MGYPPQRGRLAPSPTGWLHLGHARTFAVAAERAAGGTLVLRNENIDAQRSDQRWWDAIVEDLQWLGITWAEGPDRGGPYAPYTQQQAAPLYLEAWRELARKGYLYPCRCSRRELRLALSAPHESPGAPAEEEEPVYPGTCRPATPMRASEVPDSPAGVTWRFRVPAGEAIRFHDGHWGPLCYVAGRDFGDFAVWRRDNLCAYQLAVVVDDARQRITEVVRGADLLRSTARQLLLYRALGCEAPAWYHCPLVTDADGQRLAKRSDALSIRALREQGWAPAEVLRAAGVAKV
jgi:glutamyl/glutaminyl-tRNA synthetase